LSPTPPEELTEDAAEDEGDKLQYEWQFDILSSFPRDKAIALVEHLRRSERERAKATATALRLQRTNNTLEQQLEAAIGLLREKDPSSPRLATLLVANGHGHAMCVESRSEGSSWRWGQRLWHCLLGLLAVAVFLMPAAAFFLLASAPVAPPADMRPRAEVLFPAMAETLDTSLLSGRLEDRAAELVVGDALEAGRHLRSELEEVRTDLKTCEAKLHQPAVPEEVPPDSSGDGLVRETTVREMTPRETKTGEYDPATVARLSQENQAMKGQLERLWLDIDLAIQRKQDMVCWQL